VRLIGMSLRRRFVLAFAAYGLALAGVIGVATWKISIDSLDQALDQRLSEIAATVAGTATTSDELTMVKPGPLYEGYYKGIQNRLLTIQGIVRRSFIFRVPAGPPGGTAQYRLLVDSDGAPIDSELYFLGPWEQDISRAFVEGHAVTRSFRGEDDGLPYKYAFARITEGRPEMVGVLVPADFFAPIGALRQALLWSFAGAIFVAMFLGGLLAAGIVQPLENLSKAAIRIQRGRLDRPIYADSIGEDEVTSLARAMERMRAAIVERDERLRVMLAQVAHEIRNPLGGLELFASAAASAEDPQERRRLIARVRAEVAELNRIIDDFLTFARPLSPEYEPVDIRGAIQEAADLTEAELSHEGMLDVWLPERPLIAKADRNQIKRAVLNLLRNAAQAGTNVRVWATQEQGDLVIGVMDDGPGISAAVRDRIFEPFVSDKPKGAGLGLAIVKKVADAHGGRVEVRAASDPKYGSGAEFRLYLNASTAPTPLPAPTLVG
jgi:signal transduction histidine kinase